MGLTIAKEKTQVFRNRLYDNYRRHHPEYFSKHNICKPEINKEGVFICCSNTEENCDMTGRSHVENDICRFQYRNFHNIFRQIFPMNFVRKGHIVLDIPSGYCQVGQFIWRNMVEVEQYIAVDLDKNKLKHGQAFGWGSKWPIFVQHDMTKILPFNEHLFHIINFQEGIEHIPKRSAKVLLSNLCLLLRDDGHMIISTPIRPAKGEKTDDFHIYEWGFGELKKALKFHGFKVLKSYGFGCRKNVRTLDPLIEKYSILGAMRGYYPSAIFKGILLTDNPKEIREHMSYQLHVCVKDKIPF